MPLRPVEQPLNPMKCHYRVVHYAANDGIPDSPSSPHSTNFTFYVCSEQTTCTANEYGGTSFAAPMWAGYIALVNQQLVANGKSTIGFINPAIYTENVTSRYGTGFHDITGGTSGNYSAVPGYDLVTGWGSPNGTGLINSLARTASAPSFGPPGGFQPTPIYAASEATTGNSTSVNAVGGIWFSGIVNLACTITALRPMIRQHVSSLRIADEK